MKNTIFILFLFLASCSTAQITPEQAKDYVGKNVTVCGTVTNVYTSKKGNAFLNFGGKYPNEIFSAVIFSSDKSAFKTLDYNGQNVCVTGIIKMYEGRPEIIVKSPSKITAK